MRLNVTVKSWPGGVTISSLAQLSCPPTPNMLLLQTLISADRWTTVWEPCGLPGLHHPQGRRSALDKGATQPPSVTRARK